jgi:tetratricopeptide (TPR) repeat protein
MQGLLFHSAEAYFNHLSTRHDTLYCDAMTHRRRNPRPAAPILLLALPLVAFVACGGERSLEDIRALHAAGRFEESLEPLTELIDDGSKDPEVFYRYGVALSTTARPSQALWPLRKAMESEDWRLPAALALASGGLETGNLEEAIEAASTVLELEPDHLRALRIRANALIRTRKNLDYERAIEDADRILDLNPGDPEALIARVTALLALERAEEAEEALHDVVEAAAESSFPTQHQARFCAARAVFAQEKNEFEEAEAIHRECLEKHPTSSIVVRSAMDFFLARSQPKEATSAVLAAHRADPASREFRVGYAMRQLSSGDLEGAEQTLRAATEVDSPGLAAEAWRDVAGFMADQKRFDEAVSAYEEALAILPRPSDELLFALGDTLVLAERYERAGEIAGRLRSDSHRAMIEGRIHLGQQDPEAALERFTEGLRLWPDNVIARYYAAVAAEQAGLFDRAIEEYRYSLRVDPSATDGRYRLARILAAQGDEAAAISALHHAAQKAPATRDMALLEVELVARMQPVVGSLPPRLLAILGDREGWSRAVAAIARGAWHRAGPAAAVRVIEGGSRLDLADPVAADALRMLVRALIELDRISEARQQLEQLAGSEKAVDNSVIPALLGDVHAAAGAETEARRAYEAALEIDPEQPESLAGLASIVAATDPEAALALYARSLRDQDQDALADPAEGRSARSRAALLARLGRIDEAIAALDERLLAEPLDTRAARQLAETLRQRRGDEDLARAEKLIERADRFGHAKNTAVAREASSRPDTSNAAAATNEEARQKDDGPPAG